MMKTYNFEKEEAILFPLIIRSIAFGKRKFNLEVSRTRLSDSYAGVW